VSIASLEGLRSVLHKDPAGGDLITPSAAAAVAAAAPAADHKKTMRGLNERLSGYLGRVRQLESGNKDLQDQIDDILAKRDAPEGRDWDDIEKPLADLRKKVRLTRRGV